MSTIVRRLAPDVAVATLVLFVAAFATWPLTAHLATHVPGDLGDPLENAWIFGWGAEGVLSQPRAIFDANMFHPSRLSLAFAENMLGLSLPVAPLFWVTGNAVLVTNVATLLVYAACGWAIYRLVLELTRSRSAAVLAAIAFTLLPYRVASVSHVHVIATHLLPLAVLAVVRIARSDRVRVRDCVALAISVGWQLWASLTAGMLTVAALGAAGAWLIVVAGRRRAPAAGAVVLATLVGGLLAAPVVVTYGDARDQNPEYGHPEIEVVQNSATWSSYVFPPQGGDLADDLYDDLADAVRPRFTPQEKTLFPGIALGVALAAALVASIVLAIKRRGPLAALGLSWGIAAVGLVLSFGPRWGARESGFPMPFSLLSSLVSGGLTRVPARFGALVLLGGVCALATLVGKLPFRLRRLVTVVLVVLMAAEAWPTAVGTTRAPELTAAHRALEGTRRHVIALPMLEYTPEGALVLASVPREAVHLWYSTANFRPLVNGYGAFLPKPYVETAKVMQDFPTGPAMGHLRSLGVDTVLVETSLLPGTRWEGVSARLRAWPGAQRIDATAGTEVWDIGDAVTG